MGDRNGGRSNLAAGCHSFFDKAPSNRNAAFDDSFCPSRGQATTCSELAAIGCIAWAFAQPLFNSEKVAEVDTSATTHRVVILDSSQSMSAIESGVDGFQAARVQASRFLKTASGLKANLILAGATPEAVFESPSANVNVLNEALSKSVSQPERIDTQAAINSAAQMLRLKPHRT